MTISVRMLLLFTFIVALRSSLRPHLLLQYTGTIDALSKTGMPGAQFGREEGKTFQLGKGHVIKGWERGLVGLCVGAKVILTVPPMMGFGMFGRGVKIPGGASSAVPTTLAIPSLVSPPHLWRCSP